jgi:hypothetical protein
MGRPGLAGRPDTRLMGMLRRPSGVGLNNKRKIRRGKGVVDRVALLDTVGLVEYTSFFRFYTTRWLPGSYLSCTLKSGVGVFFPEHSFLSEEIKKIGWGFLIAEGGRGHSLRSCVLSASGFVVR